MASGLVAAPAITRNTLPDKGMSQPYRTAQRTQLQRESGIQKVRALCLPDTLAKHARNLRSLIIYFHAGVLKQMSLLDRFLPVWIIGAMGLGILLGYYVPAVEHAFSGIQIDSVSLPIAIGCAPRSTCPFDHGN